MAPRRPKYISFDCYGTLTNFRMAEVARATFADRLHAAQMDVFIADFSGYRMDEVLGAWKPYADVLDSAIRRTCARHAIAITDAEAGQYYAAVPSWGPHADVPAPLARVAASYPLVALSNAANEQIHHNIALLGAPFHAVLTAEMAQAYKPRYRAFEFMFDTLGADPADFLHVSSSFRYDLMVAHDLRIGRRAHVGRGHEPFAPHYGATPIADIGGLPGLLGL